MDEPLRDRNVFDARIVLEQRVRAPIRPTLHHRVLTGAQPARTVRNVEQAPAVLSPEPADETDHHQGAPTTMAGTIPQTEPVQTPTGIYKMTPLAAARYRNRALALAALRANPHLEPHQLGHQIGVSSSTAKNYIHLYQAFGEEGLTTPVRQGRAAYVGRDGVPVKKPMTVRVAKGLAAPKLPFEPAHRPRGYKLRPRTNVTVPKPPVQVPSSKMTNGVTTLAADMIRQTIKALEAKRDELGSQASHLYDEVAKLNETIGALTKLARGA